MSKTKMTVEAAARIQRAAANKNGGQVSKGSWAAKAMKIATKKK